VLLRPERVMRREGRVSVNPPRTGRSQYERRRAVFFFFWMWETEGVSSSPVLFRV